MGSDGEGSHRAATDSPLHRWRNSLPSTCTKLLFILWAGLVWTKSCLKYSVFKKYPSLFKHCCAIKPQQVKDVEWWPEDDRCSQESNGSSRGRGSWCWFLRQATVGSFFFPSLLSVSARGPIFCRGQQKIGLELQRNHRSVRAGRRALFAHFVFSIEVLLLTPRVDCG